MNPFFRIRWKLLILLLSIALVPLVVGSVLQRRWARFQGSRLATDQRDILINSARGDLQLIVDDYARTLVQMRDVLETVLRVQAQDVSDALAGEVPTGVEAIPVEWIDQQSGSDAHPDLGIGKKDGWGPGGEPIVQLIAPARYSVIYFAPADEWAVDDASALAANVAKVAGTADRLLTLREAWPGLIQWQHTTLASGAHMCLPGHGGYSHGYDPSSRSWYTNTRDAGKLTWTPIIDVSTGVFMVTLSMPIYQEGELVALTSIDVPLSDMVANLHMPVEWQRAATIFFAQIEDGQIRAVAEIDPDGTVIPLIASGSDETAIVSTDTAKLKEIKAEALAGRGGVRRLEFRGEPAFWAYGPSQNGKVFPLIILSHAMIDGPADEAEMFVTQQIAQGLRTTGVVLLIVVGVVTIVAVVSSGAITRPIHRLVDATDRLRKGDFEARVDIRSHDELGELGDTFNAMVPQLLENQELKKSLEVAMEIQQQLLPDASPQMPGLDIFGQAVYCDETGGDYYDFLPMGETRLGVALGDITGHGIGAALLMASARGVLRSRAEEFGDDLVGLFAVLNRHLVRDTGAGRFLTLFYAVLDVTGGERKLTSISAGHDPAMWLHLDGSVEELPNNGIPLGIIDDFPYTANESIVIAPGEVVLVGTDGIWEAMDADGEMFGKERLEQLLKTHGDRPAEEINREVVAAVLEFIGTAARTDDITLTVIRSV